MIIGILKEKPGENRVALPPAAVAALKKKNVDILVENDAGKASFSADESYAENAKCVNRKELIEKSDLLVSINAPENDTLSQVKEGKVLVSVLNPLGDKEMVNMLRKNKITSFSLDILPRTSKAQAMDILSSMATAAGYKAVLDAAMHLPRFFPMFMTAAGTIAPAKVLILGAGPAGYTAAIYAARAGLKVAFKQQSLSFPKM